MTDRSICLSAIYINIRDIRAEHVLFLHFRHERPVLWQAQLDPLTHQDLQWGALKASIVGTFFDEPEGEGEVRIIAEFVQVIE